MSRCLSQVVDVSSSGSTDIITVSGKQNIKVYKVLFNPGTDIIGDVSVKLGDRVIGGVSNPIAGGNHILVSFCGGKHEQGDDGDTLSISLPTATASKVTVHVEIKP